MSEMVCRKRSSLFASMNTKKSRRTFLQFTTAAAAAALFSGCGRSLEKITITGASTLVSVVREAANAVGKERAVKFIVEGGGTARGIEDLRSGVAQAAMLARDLSAAERREFDYVPVALDGVGILVHADNLLSGVTKADLQRIYRKEVTHWAQLGGGSGKIVAVAKDDGQGTTFTFRRFTSLHGAQLNADVIVKDNAFVLEAVAAQKGGIGFVSSGESLTDMASSKRPIRLVNLDGVEPSLANIGNGTYPMRRILSLAFRKGGSHPRVNELVAFLKSPEGAAVIRAANFIPSPEK